MQNKLSIKCYINFFLNLLITPNKFKIDYWKSIVASKSISMVPIPWMNYLAIEDISHFLSPGFNVFEYGSGSSTRYWISRGCNVVSVEHDKKYYLTLFDEIQGLCSYLLVEPEIMKSNSVYSPSSPDCFHSIDSKSLSFEAYAKAIDKFEDEFFDMVVVDGRARPSCIKRAMKKIKSGGILVLDNSDRAHYQLEAVPLLSDWNQRVFRGAVRGLLHREQTSIFIKP